MASLRFLLYFPSFFTQVYIPTLVNVFWTVATEGEQFCTSHDFSQMGNVARDVLSPLLDDMLVQSCWETAPW